MRTTRGNDSSESGQAPSGASIRLGELDSRLGFHLRLAQAVMWRDFAMAMADLQLTQRQSAVLELILVNPGISQVRLAAVLGTDRATMMAIVDRLDENGWVSRRQSDQDRRRQDLRVTAAGEAAALAARQIIADHEQRFSSRFTSRELDRLTGALKRIHRLI